MSPPKDSIEYWEMIQKISISQKERFDDSIERKSMSERMIGNKNAAGKHNITEEGRKNMVSKHLGKTSWCKGLTKETNENIRKRGEEHSKVMTGKHWKLSETTKHKMRKPKSKETKEKMSKNNWSKNLDTEKVNIIKDKISISKIGSYQNKETIGKLRTIMEKRYKENPELGKIRIQKAHEKVKELFKNNEWKENQIRKMQENRISITISKPQIQLYNYVKNIFPDAILNMTLKTNRTWRYLDIAIPSLKIDIEYDEPYWHNMRKETDIIRTKEIEEQGWKVVRFEPEILNIIK